MTTYVYKNFDKWKKEGKPSGFQNYLKGNTFGKRLLNFLKFCKEILGFLKQALIYAYRWLNFFPRLYASIPRDIQRQFITVILSVLIWRFSNWLIPLILKIVQNMVTHIFSIKTIPSSAEILVPSISNNRKIFNEVWSFVKPIAQHCIIKRM